MNTHLQTVLKSRWIIPASVGAVSFGAGAAVGYFLTRRRYNQVLTEIEVVEQLTLDFEQKIDEVVETMVGGKTRTTYVIHEKDFPDNPPVTPDPVNVFTEVDPNWDYDVECAARTPGGTYVIHRDEFFGDEMGWDSQSTLTWYAQDEVLTDEHDTVLNQPWNLIGVGMNMFGHGSGDPDVVYIRNEHLEAEYEVLRDPGSYAVQVLGGQVEDRMTQEDFKHSRSPGKFRGD